MNWFAWFLSALFSLWGARKRERALKERIQYLEEKYGEPPVLPPDNWLRSFRRRFGKRREKREPDMTSEPGPTIKGDYEAQTSEPPKSTMLSEQILVSSKAATVFLTRADKTKLAAAAASIALPAATRIVLSLFRRHEDQNENTIRRPESIPSIKIDQGFPISVGKIPKWREGMPRVIVAVDIETTGLSKADRIITIGAVKARASLIAMDGFQVETLHLIFNPERKSHFMARKAHGIEDSILVNQKPFKTQAREILDFLSDADLLVAHNAQFDIGFINRELEQAGFPRLSTKTHCTMNHHRAHYSAPAALDAASEAAGFKRVSKYHNALEDAWLALAVHLWHQGCPFKPKAVVDFSATNRVF